MFNNVCDECKEEEGGGPWAAHLPLLSPGHDPHSPTSVSPSTDSAWGPCAAVELFWGWTTFTHHGVTLNKVPSYSISCPGFVIPLCFHLSVYSHHGVSHIQPARGLGT